MIASYLFRPFPNPIAVKRPLADWLFWYGAALFMLALIPLFFWIVEPSLHGRNGLRIGADSAIYLWYAGLPSDAMLLKTAYHIEQPYPDEITFIALGGNYIGPYLIATVMQSNFGIMLLNYSLFFVSLHYLFKLKNINAKVLMVLLLINPITAVSIMTLNKEMIVLLAASLFAYYLEARSKFLLLVLLAVSVLARWEQAACVLIFLVLASWLNPLKRRRWTTLAFIMFGITLAYPQMSAFVNATFMSDAEIKGGLMPSLFWLQEHYLFALALIPKLLMNAIGNFVTMFFIKNWNWSDLQNSFVGPFSGLLMIAAAIAVMKSKRLTLRNDLIYYAAMSTVILAASPLLQPRYLYPIYIVCCVELARRLPENEVCSIPIMGNSGVIQTI